MNPAPIFAWYCAIQPREPCLDALVEGQVLHHVERGGDAAHVLAPAQAVGLLHLLAQAIAGRRHQRIGADAGVGESPLGQRRGVGLEPLLQLGLHVRIRRARREIDELEDHARLLRRVVDEPFGADAGAHLGNVAPAVEPHLVQPLAAGQQDDGLVDRRGQHELLGHAQVLGLLAEHHAGRDLDPVQRRPARALRQPDVVGGPLLEGGVVALARELAVDDGGQPPLPQLAPELGGGAFAGAGRGIVDDAHELHGQRRAAEADAGPLEGDRSIERGERNLEDAHEIDAVGVEETADMAVLVIDEAAPIVLGHLAHGDGFVIGVGDVAAELDRRVRVVDVALAVEARVESADEAAARVVDGGRQPSLGIVAQLVGEKMLTDDAAQGRDDVDEQQRECQIGHRGGHDMPEGPEIEPRRRQQQQGVQQAQRQREHQLERADQKSDSRQHRIDAARNVCGRASSLEKPLLTRLCGAD